MRFALFLCLGLAAAQHYQQEPMADMESSYHQLRQLATGSGSYGSGSFGSGSGSGSYGGSGSQTAQTPTPAPAAPTPAPAAPTPTPAPAAPTPTPAPATPTPAPKVTFKTGLGGITKAEFEKPAVQTAYKTKIAAEINKQAAARRRLANGGITAADIEIKSITQTASGGVTFEVEITVKETAGAGTDLTALATEVQSRTNNLITKLQTDTSFATTFKTALKADITAAGAAIDGSAFDSFDVGAATIKAEIKLPSDSSGGSGAAIGGAVAGVIVVGGAAFMMWKKKQGGGGAGKVTPQA